MKNSRTGPIHELLLTAFAMLLVLSVSAAVALAAPTASNMSKAERLCLGKRMYREGILPSGKPMKAIISGDIPMEGTSFTCVSCHLHSGIGSFEANIATPPTNGRILYQPRKHYIKGYEHVPLYHRYATYFPERPAYTDKTLKELITGGIDPSGRELNPVMPRYEMDDKDLDILIEYLRTLSDELSPGISKEEIKFATVIGEDVDPKVVKSMLVPLEFNVSRKNAQVLTYKNNPRMARMAYNMYGPDLGKKKFSLARWVLKGPPETWRAQLEAYYKAEPVFVLLSGAVRGPWKPIHQFCEENHIPDLFPITDFPVISDSDWYTLYASRGFRQEGEAAARYLHTMHDLFGDRPLVQVVRDTREGRAMADGFRKTWKDRGHEPAVDIVLKQGEPLDTELLQKIIKEHHPAALIVWDDAEMFTPLQEMTGLENSPGIVLASSSYLGKSFRNIPEPLRKILYLTYPYRLPKDEARFDKAVKTVLVGKPLADYDQRALRQAYIVGEVLGTALPKMRSEFYRDYFLDVIGMMADASYPLYERIGFGPGQRYASKGCYIVQLGKGENPQLQRRSEWVTQ